MMIIGYESAFKAVLIDLPLTTYPPDWLCADLLSRLSGYCPIACRIRALGE
jgi:hypothetical protein